MNHETKTVSNYRLPSPLKRIFYGDFKWNKLHLNHPLNRKILQLQRDSHIQKSNLDPLKILRDDKRNTWYYLYYSKHHRLDRLHCERMRNIKGFALRPYERGGHHILKDMKESGLLAKIIQESLLPPDRFSIVNHPPLPK